MHSIFIRPIITGLEVENFALYLYLINQEEPFK